MIFLSSIDGGTNIPVAQQIPMPPVKPPKKKKIDRIYEDENWVIDKIGDRIRISYFEDYHFVDEKIISREDFYEEKNNCN